MSVETAKALIKSNNITEAEIQCFDGRRWAIVLRAQEKFVLRSARQNPKAFAKLETALAELQNLGLHHAKVDFSNWNHDQNSLQD